VPFYEQTLGMLM